MTDLLRGGLLVLALLVLVIACSVMR